MAYSKSPSEYFIKYLISKREYDVNTVMRVAEDFGLDPVSSQYVTKLFTQMSDFPDPWDPVNDQASKNYLKKHGVHDLWFPNQNVQEAYRILASPQLRSDVEQLLLSPLRVEDVARRLSKHHEVTITPEGLEAYGHYFWNRGLLSMHEWVDFLDDKPRAYECITAMRTSPDVAQSLVPWVTGLAGPPANLNTGTVARRMRDVAFLKVLEIERQPATLAHSKMMKNYMDVVKAAESEMRQSDVALKDVLQAFEKFRLRKVDDNIPSIEEVAGPNYSQSGEGTDRPHSVADEIMEEDYEDG